MFCPNCGSQMSDGAVFCPNCGYKKENNQSTNAPKVSMPKIPIVPIACVAGIILLVIILVNVLGNRTCKYCDRKVYKSGMCQEHYAEYVTKENVNAVINGEKDWKEAAKDTYDKSFTKDQKKEMEDAFNQGKDLINGLFGN